MMPSALDTLPRLPPVEPAADTAPADRAAPAGSFHTYLQQAQSHGAAATDPGGNNQSRSRQADSPATTSPTSQDNGNTAAQSAEAEGKHPGKDSSATSQGKSDNGHGDSSNGDGGSHQAASGNADPRDRKGRQAAGDGTDAAVQAAAQAAAAIATPLAAPADAQGVAQGNAGAAAATTSAQTVGGKPLPAAPATTLPGPVNPAAARQTAPLAAAAAGLPDAAAGPTGVVGTPTGTAQSTGATRRSVAATPQPDTTKAADMPTAVAAGPSPQAGGPNLDPAAPLAVQSAGQSDAAPAAAAAAMAQVAATAAVETSSAAKAISSAAEPNSPAEKDAAKPVAGDAATTALSAAASPASQQAHPTGPAAATAAAPADAGQVNRARFTQRVEQAFQSMSDSGGTVRLKLSPPELGSMRLEVTVRNGVLTARAETETPAARNLLLDNLPALRQRLAQQDIKVQQFDVDLMDSSRGGTPGQAYSNPDSNNRNGNHGSNPAAAADAGDGATAAEGGAAHARERRQPTERHYLEGDRDHVHLARQFVVRHVQYRHDCQRPDQLEPQRLPPDARRRAPGSGSTQPVSNTEILQEVSQIDNIQTNQTLSNTLTAVALEQSMSTASNLLNMNVSAVDASGNTVSGPVSSISIANGLASLTVNGTSVPFSNITSISPAGSAASAASQSN